MSGKYSWMETIILTGVAVMGSAYFFEPAFIMWFVPLLGGNYQKIYAIGDVIVHLNAEASTELFIQNSIHKILPAMNKDLVEKIPGNSTVAILSILSDSPSLSENVIDEIELDLVDSRKFTVVDRRRLADIRKEQNFQLSGDVSDDSAVSIGHILGANIVIVGSITATATSGRVTLRALDVKTGEVIAIASGQF
jgi:TolB-like protein